MPQQLAREFSDQLNETRINISRRKHGMFETHCYNKSGRIIKRKYYTEAKYTIHSRCTDKVTRYKKGTYGYGKYSLYQRNKNCT